MTIVDNFTFYMPHWYLLTVYLLHLVVFKEVSFYLLVKIFLTTVYLGFKKVNFY